MVRGCGGVVDVRIEHRLIAGIQRRRRRKISQHGAVKIAMHVHDVAMPHEPGVEIRAGGNPVLHQISIDRRVKEEGLQARRA